MEEPDESITSTVKQIMHVHGDAGEPLEETARLLISLVEQQMQRYLQAAEESVFRRSRGKKMKKASILDILIGLRGNRRLLSRAIYALILRKVTRCYEEEDEYPDDVIAFQRSNRMKICTAAVHLLYPPGETVGSLVAAQRMIGLSRSRRILEASRNLSPEQLRRFSDARAASFCQSKRSLRTFSAWLAVHGFDGYLETFKHIRTDVLAIVAQEIIVQVMEIVLTLRGSAAFGTLVTVDQMKEAIRLYLARLAGPFVG